MSALGKPFLKKSDKKKKIKTKKQKINVKMPHVNNKPLARYGNMVQTKKLGLEWTMNGLGNHFEQKPIQKKQKNCKNQSEIAVCEQKNH